MLISELCAFIEELADLDELDSTQEVLVYNPVNKSLDSILSANLNGPALQLNLVQCCPNCNQTIEELDPGDMPILVSEEEYQADRNSFDILDNLLESFGSLSEQDQAKIVKILNDSNEA